MALLCAAHILSMVLCLVLDVPGFKEPNKLDFLEGGDQDGKGSRDAPGRIIEGTGEKIKQDHDSFLQILVPWKMELTSM